MCTQSNTESVTNEDNLLNKAQSILFPQYDTEHKKTMEPGINEWHRHAFSHQATPNWEGRGVAKNRKPQGLPVTTSSLC